MRWNCPHCEELVTAGIDFEATKQAYVRCGKCGGMALIHRSAALAGFVKARRLEEEAQLNAEIQINEARIAASQAKAAIKIEPIPAIATVYEMEMIASPGAHGSMESIMPIKPERVIATPPPFNGPRMDTTAAPPVFAYPKPPAFLTKNISAQAASSSQAQSAASTTKPVLANLAIWIAAAIAIASGVYLYIQGKQALSTTDLIVSKASSGIRVEEITEKRNIGLVRVTRAVVRGSPSTGATIIGTLEQATALTILEEKDGWIRIESPNLAAGKTAAWMRSDLIARVPN